MSITKVLDFEKQAIFDAIHTTFQDFEETLNYFLPKYQKNIDVIVTRNTKDFKLSETQVLTPKTFLKSYKYYG